MQYATYSRDSTTNLDYAHHRYYSSQIARFLTPDPYIANSSRSGDAQAPQSWNRYSYSLNDPVNLYDPPGLYAGPPGGTGGVTIGYGGGPGGGSGGGPPQDCAEMMAWTFGLRMVDPDFAGFLAAVAGCEAAASNSGGGGGGGGGGTPKIIADAVAAVLKDLKKENCANDFRDAADDLNAVNSTHFQDEGKITYRSPAPGSGRGPQKGTWSGQISHWNPITGSIILNSEINWADPNNTPDLENGRPGIYRALDAEANFVDDFSMTAAQYMEIMIIHELAHKDSAIGDPDKPKVEQQLWNDCIK
jgi:RHS repeat-associated protein